MVALKESLRQKLDWLNEEQLKQVAKFIAFLEFISEPKQSDFLSMPAVTPRERVLEWHKSVVKGGTARVNLPEAALHRDTIYEE